MRTRPLLMSHGDASVFVTSPISLAILLPALVFVVVFAVQRRADRAWA
jgi:TctA family transporter